MNGNNYLFDTNALINFFKGDPSLQPFLSVPISLSIVSVIEFLSFPQIEEAHKTLLRGFLKKAEVVDINLSNKALVDNIINIRSLYKLKLPDAIIAATALYLNATLITNDSDFKKLKVLKTLTY